MHKEPPLYQSNNLDLRLQSYLEAYNRQQVEVTRTNRQKCRNLTQTVLKEIMARIVSQTHGNLYTEKIRPAGSTSTQTKIGKMDEFDYNVVLKEPFVDRFKHSGSSINYCLRKVRQQCIK